MGSDQSQPKTNSKAGESGENVSPTVEIDRSEIPEAYKVVRISDNGIFWHNYFARFVFYFSVFKRVKENMNDGEERKTQSHSDAKPRTTEDRKSLKKSQTVQDAISLEHVEEVKKAFDETVEKVQKQFFNYRRENACAENESVRFLA